MTLVLHKFLQEINNKDTFIDNVVIVPLISQSYIVSISHCSFDLSELYCQY
jgi:hypothetical protein